MNRREAIKAAIGISALGAVGKIVPEQAIQAGSSPSNPPSLPPLDNRTPEEIWRNEVEQEANSILSRDDRYWHHVRYVPGPVFQRIESKLIADGRTITVIHSDSIPLQNMVVNGNVIIARW